ncbi:hypothetical protein BDR05DRAFT_952340 [Suillus weaverae]|nr:hypothetical protein BDR05DRAFT_952340 [Suillus weaverae]
MGLYGGAAQDVDETGGDVFTEEDYAANAKDLLEVNAMATVWYFSNELLQQAEVHHIQHIPSFSTGPIPGVDESGQTIAAAETSEMEWLWSQQGRPERWPVWLYTHSLVMDGNFKAKHLHPVHPEDEVWLTDGKCFMAHLTLTQDLAECSECNNHRVVNQANASQHKLEAMGIGGCACARHGCFGPNPMVDFQKGKRQMNMDCALCNALGHNTDGLTWALVFYDANCQHSKYHQQRVDESIHLTIPSGMDIIPGIGLWHVHSHQDRCFVWYASNFIEGAARIDREIMEMLWAPLNMISPSTRGMSTPHRQECLDYHMNDCNFMKMICMGLFLSQKYKEAKQGVIESSRAFNEQNDAADPDMVDWWEIQEMTLHKASGITIKEMQIALAIEMRKMGGHPTETQTLEIGPHRIRLQHTINKFIVGAMRYLGEDFDEDDHIPDMDINFIDDEPDANSDDKDSEDDLTPGRNRRVLFQPERVVIPLPSNLGVERCEELGIGDLVRQEITLREGQANDMLHAIRVHLANKAVLFRTTVRLAKSQATTTHVWSQVHSVEWVINLNSTIYKKCRAQLLNLGADQLLEKYRELHKSDLKATSAVADPNARGQRTSTLPWFWSLDVQGDSVSNDWMNEFDIARTPVYRVHWLHTKALQDRWAKELLLVGHEMHWTINFLNGEPGQDGLSCYVIRQAQMCRLLAEDARARFIEDGSRFVWHLIWEVEKFIFPFINICTTSNTSPALLEYLNNVVKMLTEWQVGLLDDNSLFQKFWSSKFDLAGDLMARYRMVSSFSYSWWKDCFDTMPCEMPDRLSLEEVRELYQAHMEQMLARYLLLPDMSRRKGGSDPLLTNLHVLRDDLEEFGDHLQTWLSKKTDEGRIALEAMA